MGPNHATHHIYNDAWYFLLKSIKTEDVPHKLEAVGKFYGEDLNKLH